MQGLEPGLSGDDLREYHRALLEDTVMVRCSFDVLTMDGEHIGTLRSGTSATPHPSVIDGQIAVKRSAPQRVCTLTIHDPARAMTFDPSAPGVAGLSVLRQIRVGVSVYIPALGEWVEAVPFYGPVRDFNRSGEEVTVTAHSRDVLGMGQLWVPFGRKRGTVKTDAIRALLDRYGETRRSIPSLKSRLPGPLNLGRDASPWSHAQSLASSMTRQLYYSGRGYAILRAWPQRPVMSFDDAILPPGVRVTRNIDGLVNAVQVLGAKPKGARTRIRAVAVLRSPTEPLSAGSLAPGDGRVFLGRTFDRPHLRSRKEAQAYADHQLRELARQLVKVEFDCLPVWHLDTGDMVTAGDYTLRLGEFSMPIPVGDGGDGPPMTVGHLKRTTRATHLTRHSYAAKPARRKAHQR